MKISIDSRTIQPGDYYIPVKGNHFDGRDYIKDAIEKGGILLDVDLATYAKQYRKKLSCTVIGITGSAGKTTVKDMLSAVLSEHYTVVKTKENQNNEIGVPLTLLSANSETDVLLVEMGLRKKGDLTYLTQLVQPNIVIMTGIGKAHIEFFSNQRQLAHAKCEIFRRALQWQSNATRHAFIQYRSAYSSLIQEKAHRAGYEIIPYEGDDKLSENLNLSYAIGNHFNLSEETIQNGLSRFQSSSHRLNVLKTPTITLIDDSYNANPDGVQYALQYMRRFKGRKIIVLGDMLELGKHSQAEHQAIVDHAINEEVDLMFLFGEQTKQMSSDVLSLLHYESRDELHRVLSSECKPGDIVLIKGSRSLAMEKTVAYLYDTFK